MRLTDWQDIMARANVFCMKLQNKGYRIFPDFLYEAHGKSISIFFYDKEGLKRSYQTCSSEDYYELITDLTKIMKKIEGELK